MHDNYCSTTVLPHVQTCTRPLFLRVTLKNREGLGTRLLAPGIVGTRHGVLAPSLVDTRQDGVLVPGVTLWAHGPTYGHMLSHGIASTDSLTAVACPGRDQACSTSARCWARLTSWLTDQPLALLNLWQNGLLLLPYCIDHTPQRRGDLLTWWWRWLLLLKCGALAALSRWPRSLLRGQGPLDLSGPFAWWGCHLCPDAHWLDQLGDLLGTCQPLPDLGEVEFDWIRLRTHLSLHAVWLV